MDSFEITKHEIIASASIIAILLILGLLLSGKISDYESDKNEMYNKALKVTTKDIFEYGMRTNVGNAFVYGELKAVDTVGFPGIAGEYMYIKRDEERYTKHTRRVSHTKTVNGKTETYYTTETYWTWDWVGSTSKQCKGLSFNGVVFNVNKIDIPGATYIDTVKESRKLRYKYYGTDTIFTGTIFTELRDNTISDNSSFYKDRNISETFNLLTSGGLVFIFWFFWIILIVGCVYLFYKFDNHWLE